MFLHALLAMLLLACNYLLLRNLTLIGLMGFFSEICDANSIKVSCTCVYILLVTEMQHMVSRARFI